MRLLAKFAFGTVPLTLRLGLAVMMSGAFAYYLFGSEFIAGRSAVFHDGDALQNVSGWVAFARTPWGFPILHTDLLNAPEGASIAITDSIPLAALLFKLLLGVGPTDFHYFGVWHLIGYLLQGLATVYLLERLGVRSWLAVLVGCTLALTFPVLVYPRRLGHTALISHGLLILGLALYYRLVDLRPAARSRSILAFATLIQASLLIHPYLFAMMLPLGGCALIEVVRRRLLGPMVALAWLGFLLSLSVLTMWLFGYLDANGSSAGGYDFFSLNLAAPFCGGVLCPFVDGTGGQYEGYAYLGVGVLLLLVVALSVCAKAAWHGLIDNPVLVLLLAGYVIYALSNKVMFLDKVVVHPQLPAALDTLTHTFRAGGRFVWLPMYGLLFFALYHAFALRRLAVAVILVLCTVTQVLDIWSVMQQVRAKAHEAPAPDDQRWRQDYQGYQALYVYPAFRCGELPDGSILKYQYRAAVLGIPVNTGYMARSSVDCSAKYQQMQQAASGANLLIMPGYSGDAFSTPSVFLQAIADQRCRYQNGDLLCSTGGPNPQDWAGSSHAIPRHDTKVWSGAELNTLNGIKKGQWLETARADVGGYLAFGPYVDLFPGRYNLTWQIKTGTTGTRTDLGRWDILGTTEEGSPITLGAGVVSRTSEIKTSFMLEAPVRRVEFRMISNGVETLTIKHISLTRLDR